MPFSDGGREELVTVVTGAGPKHARVEGNDQRRRGLDAAASQFTAEHVERKHTSRVRVRVAYCRKRVRKRTVFLGLGRYELEESAEVVGD